MNPAILLNLMSRTTVIHPAPAKLNLALSVGPPDAGGMHPICSWMVTISLFDELHVTRLEPGALSRYAILWHEEARRRSEIDWSIRKDLTVQAHLALEEAVGRSLPVQLKLEKRIPVAGGLGGGSSDAAAMLQVCNSLFDLNLEPEALERIAAPLGSDVAFFVRGGSALVEGRGEQITPLEALPPLHVVLIFPDLACPTGSVYRSFDERDGDDRAGAAPDDAGRAAPQPERIRELTLQPVTWLAEAELPNDLTDAALSVAPELAQIRRRIRQIAARPVHVAGSGSSLFVLADDPLHARALAQTIERETELPAVPVRTWRPGEEEEAI